VQFPLETVSVIFFQAPHTRATREDSVRGSTKSLFASRLGASITVSQDSKELCSIFLHPYVNPNCQRIGIANSAAKKRKERGNLLYPVSNARHNKLRPSLAPSNLLKTKPQFAVGVTMTRM